MNELIDSALTYLLDVPNKIVSRISVDACYTEFPPHIIKVTEIH